MEDYAIATYVDLGFWWWMATSVTVMAWAPEGALVARFGSFGEKFVRWGALAVDVLGIAVDIEEWKYPQPVDATYPVIFYDPLHIGRAPRQLHFTAPTGRQRR
jgi:hypothetical protein